MLGVATGFGIIAFLVVVGYLVARLGVLPPGSGLVLNRTAFFVASPALLFGVVAHADVHVLFSRFLLVAAASALTCAAAFALLSRVAFRLPVADTFVGAASAGYVNANNIGLPVATYVIGDPQYVAPLIMLQVLVFSPVILGVLDLSTRGQVRARDIVLQPVRNPIVLASALGLVVALAGWTLPAPVLTPLSVLGGAAVPLMLLAFGMSLRGQRPLAFGSARRAAVVATVLKAAVMPVVASLLGTAAHLSAPVLYAVVVTSALPTAQNMNNYAARYGRAELLARDVVLLTTIASGPVILLVAALLR